MSSHTHRTKVDQKEYLKKYLSGEKHKKKKKKDYGRDGKEKVRIIDDDAHVPGHQHYIDEELLLTGEDAPQIVGEYEEERTNGDSKKSKWRSIGVKEEMEEKRNNFKSETDDLWGRKASEIKTERKYSPDRKNHFNKNRAQSNDASPPRRRRNSISPQRKRRSSSNDISPPRRKRSISPNRKHFNSRDHQEKHYPVKKEYRSRSRDHSPPRRGRKPSRERFPRRNSLSPKPFRRSDDLSPPRQRNYSPRKQPPQQYNKNTRDQSPPRREYQKNSFNAGNRRRESPLRGRQSPPRGFSQNTNHRNPFKQSPKKDLNNFPSILTPTSNRHNNFNEPRQSRWNKAPSSPKRNQRDFSNNRQFTDKSPPRRPQHMSPPRRQGNPFRKDSVSSPPRRSATTANRKQSLSPRPMKREKRFSNDWSPSRNHSPSRRYQNKPFKPQHNRSLSPPPTHKPRNVKTLEGKKAGLQDAHSLRLENEDRRRQEDRAFANMPSEYSGRDAEVNVRSTGRRGYRARNAEEEDPVEKRRKEEREKQKKEIYDRWGKGLKQVEDHRARRAEENHESNKPLARYRDDEDLEKHLKEKEHADDPMLAYMRQKRKEREKAENKKSIPIYEGPYPENRFGIRPGYRWDGVDRSNGFEKKWFAAQNERRAHQEDAYKYSVEDM